MRPRHFIPAIAAAVLLAGAPCAAGEHVAFTSSDGHPLAGIWAAPETVNGPPTVLVLVHDTWEDASVWEPMLDGWHERGYSTFAIDMRGFGMSRTADDGDPLLCAPAEPDLPAFPEDIAAALSVVRERAPEAAIFIVGSGDGADNGLLVASRDTSVRGVAMLSPALRYPERFYPDVTMEDVLRAYGTRSLYVASGVVWEPFQPTYDETRALIDSLDGMPTLTMQSYGSVCSMTSAFLHQVPEAYGDLNAWLAEASGRPARDVPGSAARGSIDMERTTDTLLPVPPENVTISGADGFPIRGSLYLPPMSADTERVIVLFHGASGNRNAWRPYLAKFLDAGWTVLNLDMRGHGESVRRGDLASYWCRSWESVKNNMAEDMRRSVAFVRTRFGDVRVVAMGASMGGNAALLAAAEDRSISGVVLLSAGLQRPRFDVDATIRQYGNVRPMLVISAAGDPEAAERGRHIKEIRPLTTYIEVPGTCTHGEPLLGEVPELQEQILNWAR